MSGQGLLQIVDMDLGPRVSWRKRTSCWCKDGQLIGETPPRCLQNLPVSKTSVNCLTTYSSFKLPLIAVTNQEG